MLLALLVVIVISGIRAFGGSRETSGTLPDPGPEGPTAPGLAARLEELEAARAAGLLTDEEYAKKRADVLERF